MFSAIITGLSFLTRQILIKFCKVRICPRANSGAKLVCQEATGAFASPVYFEWPDRLRIPLDAQGSLWGIIKTGKKAAAARSTGLRPIHFSNRGKRPRFQLQVTIITKV